MELNSKEKKEKEREELKKERSQQTVLIVDDEPEIIELLIYFLKTSGFKVLTADNGAKGIEVFNSSKIDAIVSDAKMPVMDGVEMLTRIRKMDPKVPFIILTAYLEDIDSQHALKLNADVLTKPFRPEELIEVLDSAIKSSADGGKETLDDIYKKVSISHISEGHYFEFNRYIRLNPFKFVLLAFAGDKLDSEKVQKYRSKGVNFLYIKKDDIDKQLKQQTNLGKLIVRNGNSLTQSAKATFISKSGRLIFDKIKNDRIDDETYNQAREYFSATTELVTDPKVQINLFEVLSRQSDFLHAHSVGVSVVSCMIAKHSDIVSNKLLSTISVAGFLHDVGKSALDEQIYSTPIHRLSEIEKELLKEHPDLGYNITKQANQVPEIVHSVILQHHENCVGEGYPGNLRASQISKATKIVSIANDFCNLTIDNPRFRKMSPSEAIHQLETTNSFYYDKQAFMALKRVYGYLT